MATAPLSLFNTPEQIMQARQAAALQQAQQFGQMGPAERVGMGAFYAGNQLGNAGMAVLGAQDPELAKVRDIQSMFRDVDRNDYKSLESFAKSLADKGYSAEAEQAWQKAQELKQQLLQNQKLEAEANKLNKQAAVSSVFGKINPQFYTPESLAAFAESGNYADLQLNQKTIAVAQSKAGKIAADRGFKPGTPEFADEVRKVEAELKQQADDLLKSKSKMPVPIAKQVDELQSHVDTFNNNIQDINGLITLMDENKVKFSPGDNLESFLKTVFNNSDEAARVKSDLRTTVEGMRNAILQGNKGTQTEGDAERAANEILSAIDKNDTATVYRRLSVLKTKFERAMEQRKSRMNSLMTMYGGGRVPEEEQKQPSPLAAPQPQPQTQQKIASSPYPLNMKTPADVKAAVKSGKLDRDSAKIILKEMDSMGLLK